MSIAPQPYPASPGDDVLDDLYNSVMQGFAQSPTESTVEGSQHSLESVPEYRYSTITTGLLTDPMPSSPQHTEAYTPNPLSPNPLTPPPPPPTIVPSPSPAPPPNPPTAPRRRPLPQPPGSTPQSSPPVSQSNSQQPPQPSAPQAGPSTLQVQPSPAATPAATPATTLSRSRSRKISRDFSQIASRYSNLLETVTDDNGAGPSGPHALQWNSEEEIPTSPSTEFPDHYGGAFLPGYIEKAHDDPNASASIAFSPPVDFASAALPFSQRDFTPPVLPEDDEEDYTGPPPDETFEESSVDSRYQSTHSGASVASVERWNSTSSQERWNVNEGGTMLSTSQYSMLRPPPGSDFPRNNETDSIGDQESFYRTSSSVTNLVEVTVGPRRVDTNDSYDVGDHDDWAAGPSDLSRRNTNVIQAIANFDQRTHLELHEEEAEDFYDDDERRFINPSLLSHLAVQLRDLVPRGTHVKGSIQYPRAFTGKDIVSTLHSIIQRGIAQEYGTQLASDRRAAILVARSLQTTLFFYEVEWGARVLQDGVEDVYMFMDDQEGPSDTPIERAELPTGVVTILTKCYVASCDGAGCYAYGCPRKGMQQLPSIMDAPAGFMREDWSKKVPLEVLESLSESEINRQTIIHKLISKEEQYIDDLDIIESVFMRPLRTANPPIMTPLILDEFIEEVFGNILEIRECNRRLLEVMYVRQREQHPVIQSVGDIFLDAATEFRTVYPEYVGQHPLAEKRMKEELEHNTEFRLFIEKCSRQLASRPGVGPRLLDLKHYLNRPAEHLQKYPVLLNAVYGETEESNPDGDYLREAIDAIRNLQSVAQLRTFQSAMGKGGTGRWEWHDLVSEDNIARLTNQERKRQSVIFELIKGEMAYVRDLENIGTMYVRPLRNAEPPIISSKRLEQFLYDVFHNFSELLSHHKRLVESLHEIQREEHPQIRSITEKVFDAALNFREAYMEYIPNYPIAAYRIDEEMANNPAFKNFVNHTVRHPDAHRLDMKSFINRPIPRLLRYELLLRQILTETPSYFEDRETIPQVIDVIKALGRETEPGVASSKQKVELWRYNSNLVFKNGENVDLDLLNEQRSLIHTGKLISDGGNDELFVMLFDNYFVMSHPREKDGIIKYHVYRRPIPLELLALVKFSDSPIQRSTSLLRSFWGNNGGTSSGNERHADTASISSRAPDGAESRALFPFTIHHNGRLGANGHYVLYAESVAARLEWKQKLEESKGLRKVVQDANKVFEIESLSVDTFLLPTMTIGPTSSVWQDGTFFTGKVTCSVPFNTPDGRGLVAIGCAEGVWIGYRHDSKSLRRVLHLKMVTQCAILDDFGLFIVLADKVLYAYHLEALVPTTPGSIHASQTPQKIHGKDVHFFSVGVLHGRTLVIYMKKRGNNDSVFHAIEPVIDKINERPKTSSGFMPNLKKKTEWFRNYKDFSFSDAYDLIFLKARIAVLCAKGFMIMDLNDYKSVNIPQRDDPSYPHVTKRCDACRPLGIFRCGEDEFLLCYDEMGLFVNRQGHPSRKGGIIEWEGTAERVALHAPYVLLFDQRFIEVRHLETGRLAQIIPGNEIRCVWDGRNVNEGSAIITQDGTEEHMFQEPRVHAVLNMAEPPGANGRLSRGIIQHVFELFPTIPLYLPGSLSSPTTAPYFPVSYSPPRSPPLRSHHI